MIYGIAYYYNAHDQFNNLRRLYNDLIIQRNAMIIDSEPNLESLNVARSFYNKPKISFKFREYVKKPNSFNKGITNDPIKAVINARTLSSVDSCSNGPIMYYDDYYNTKHDTPDIIECKKQQRKF